MLGDDILENGNTSTRFAKVKGEEGENELAKFGDSNQPKILVIEDNVWDARLMKRLLEAKNRFEVIVASNTEQAWETLANNSPDLIILDLILPDQTGEDFLKELKEKNNGGGVPVMVVSGKEINPNHRSRMNVLADSVWSKNMLDRNSLLTHIEKLLTD